MEITRQAQYAVRAMVNLSEPPWDRRVSTGTISERADIPFPFLTKVISRLMIAGLVDTMSGMGGGVALTRSPEEITLLQVIQAAEGPVRLNRCLLRPGACELEPCCAAHETWAEVQARLVQRMDAVTMAELARRQAAKETKAPN